ncbi:MAG: hypothetical protein QG654_97 [Patescibacteria group bacterium]|nr:hypothetical protein [Patescibacteria group bacterium]
MAGKKGFKENLLRYRAPEADAYRASKLDDIYRREEALEEEGEDEGFSKSDSQKKDRLPSKPVNEVGNKDNDKPQGGYRPMARDPFNLRDSRKAGLDSGESSLRLRIDELANELKNLHNAEIYLLYLDGKGVEVPKPDEKYISGQSLISIREKIDSRNKDLDYLEEGLGKSSQNGAIKEKEISTIENKIMSPSDFRGGSDLEDAFNLTAKNKSSEGTKMILNFQLKTLERDLKSAVKKGDTLETERIREDIENIKNSISSLGDVSEKQKINQWPPVRAQGNLNENISNKKDLGGVVSPEAFRGGEKDLGLDDPLNLEKNTEGIITQQENISVLNHEAVIENDTDKFIEAIKNGRLNEASHYKDSLDHHRGALSDIEKNSFIERTKAIIKNDEEKLAQAKERGQSEVALRYEQSLRHHKDKLAGFEDVSRKENISGEENIKNVDGSKNRENKKESSEVTGKFLPALGYSNEDMSKMSYEDRTKAFREQTLRDAWFAQKAEASAPAPSSGATEVAPSPASTYTLKQENIYHAEDGTVTYEKIKKVVSAEEAAEHLSRKLESVSPEDVKKRIDGLENIINVLKDVPSAGPTLEIKKKELESLLKQKKEQEEYKKRESELSSLGWTFEKYNSLTEEQKQYVYWYKIPADDFEVGKDTSQKESVAVSTTETPDEEILAVNFLNSVWNKRTSDGSFNLTKAEEGFYNKHKEAIDREYNKREQIDLPKENIFEKSKEYKISLTREGNPIPKDAEEYLKAKIEKDKNDLSAKGTSEGVKEFLGDEKLLTGLEKGYENFDKEQLIEVAKKRGLSSGGDKQKVIERLIKDDIENKTTDFGFAENEIESKLTEFNLSERDMVLLSPEFFALSTEKQKYLLSKLEQKIYLDAEFASKDKNEEQIKGMGFFKRMGASFVKGQRQVALRDKIIQDIKKSGIKDYRSDILTLNSYLADAPDLSYTPNEKGRLVPHFEYVETASSDKKFETPKVFFNVAASRFSEIPFEWSLKSATSSQREAYQKVYSSYTGAKESLMRAMLEEAKLKNPNINEEGEKTIRQNTLLEIAKADAQVKFGTFITQNPEMENLSANFFEKVLGAKANDFARGAMFAGAGFATKWLGRSMAVTGVGLAVSGAVGGFMADRKVRLAYTEKELRKRYGAEVKDLGIKTSINSKNVYERLSGLVNQLEKTTDEKGKQRILETIKTRIFVTEEMMRDGRINFGSQKEHTLNQYKLSEMMSNAAVTIEMNRGFSEQKTEEEKVFDRFKQFVKDDSRQISKDAERLMAVMKGASVAMLGFSVGAGIRYAQEQGYLGAAWEAISEKGSEGFKKAKEIISDFSTEDTRVSPLPKIPNVIENATPVETVMAGSRGVIGAIDDMQDNLKLKFGNNIPEQYKEFLSKDPNKLAREWGFYKPGEVNESAVIKKGEGFSIDSKGVVRFVGLNGTDEVYIPKGVNNITAIESERNFFDSGKSGAASVETPASIETESLSFESEPVRGPEVVNEGYVTSKEVKPESRNWFEKPAPTEFSASNVRGEWKFITSPDGKITGINTSRTISDDVINFRKNPRNFMTVDLKNTKLLAPTDSFAVKTLTNNREIIEKFLTEKNILNASNSNLTAEQTTFLKDSVSTLNKEIQFKTGGAFDGKYEEPSVFGKLEKSLDAKPEKITYFETDNQIKPKINPSVTSVSEGSDFVPKKEVVAPESSPLVSGSQKIKIGDLEIVKTSNDVIDEGSKLFKTAVERYGKPSVSGNVSTFGERYIGFYEDEIDQAVAIKKIEEAARQNKKILGRMIDQIAVKDNLTGRIKILFVYEKK